MISPETSIILNDGDIITFGKAVGKGDEWVKPVIARVQLLHASASMAFTVPSPSSEKSKSGRYGIHEAGESSSSDSSDSDYSDIEEIPPPPSSFPSNLGSHEEGHANGEAKLTSQLHDSSHMTSAFSAFKQFLSPAIRKLPSVSEIIGDRNIGLFDSEKSQSPFIFSAPVRKLDDTNAVCISVHGTHGSRSSSPMDMESPVTDFVVSSNPSTYVPSILPDSHTDDAAIEENTSLSTVISPCDRESLPLPQLPSTRDTSLHDSLPLATDPPATEEPSSSAEMTEILQTLKQLESSVSKLQSARRKYKSRFNANVAFISRKLSEIDDKFAEVDAEYNVLCDQMDGVQHRDVPDLVKQVEDLGERVELMTSEADERTFETTDIQPYEEREDVKSYTQAMHDTVAEMRQLNIQTRVEISKELLAIRTMRQQAMEEIAQAKADIIASATVQLQVCFLVEVVPSDKFIHHTRQTPVATSLKRKRDDTNENEEVVTRGEEAVIVPTGEAFKDMMSPAETVVPIEINEKPGLVETQCLDGPPPYKKSRKIGSVIAQTASALTIGAVVTWSALAFS